MTRPIQKSRKRTRRRPRGDMSVLALQDYEVVQERMKQIRSKEEGVRLFNREVEVTCEPRWPEWALEGNALAVTGSTAFGNGEVRVIVRPDMRPIGNL